MRFFILLCLIIASGFFSPSNYTATAAARVPYPENTQNSCLRAVKTWVSDHHHSNVETMKQLCEHCVISDPESPSSLAIIHPVTNNPDDKRYFGKLHPTIPPIETPFLQWVKSVGEHKEPTTLEIAGGWGFVSWKVPFAFSSRGGRHYMNELSAPMVENAVSIVLPPRLNEDLRAMITTLPGDCFDVLEENAELKGKCNAIYVQSLEHFFNPTTHKRFIQMICDLLAPGGRAFLSSNGPLSFNEESTNPSYVLYQERKRRGDLYPLFQRTIIEFLQLENDERMINDESKKLLSAERPADDAPMERATLEVPSKEIYKGRSVLRIKQSVMHNYFTPDIYKGVVAQFPNLTVLDSFFIQNDRLTTERLWSPHSFQAAVIIEKKSI